MKTKKEKLLEKLEKEFDEFVKKEKHYCKCCRYKNDINISEARQIRRLIEVVKFINEVKS